MQFFRSKKMIWSTTVLMLWALLLPFSGAQKAQKSDSALTNWLLTFAYEQTADDALHKIASLNTSDAPIQEVMQQASQIIFSHPELFRSPLGKTTNSDADVYEVLLMQWNLQQEASGMSKGVQIERTRAVAYQQATETTPKTWSSFTIDARKMGWTPNSRILPGTDSLIDLFIRPFLGGIAINAP